ncbi:hypothetical protein BDQ94DRAFT_147683 [Aspergillus welwitschiae]|uniref:Uncharacterized protein n=1 Tax=Aspergillus welwitschiae TaxID=1341132 RepID=A0A3F3PWF8_9EURO|nr:hypothetical protein BDQ94DRAFT_147683 [Aspergillus welwitschiae]RDH31223.1 hypothetical protein BDQ94DRAFT_147683 [Aspergillus welwitschiae]
MDDSWQTHEAPAALYLAGLGRWKMARCMEEAYSLSGYPITMEDCYSQDMDLIKLSGSNKIAHDFQLLQPKLSDLCVNFDDS